MTRKVIPCKPGDRVRIPKYSALFLPGDVSPEEEIEKAKIIYIVEAVEPSDESDSIRNYGEVIEGLCDVDLREEVTGKCFAYFVDNSHIELVID